MCLHLDKVKALVIQGHLGDAVKFAEDFVKRFRDAIMPQESGKYNNVIKTRKENTF